MIHCPGSILDHFGCSNTWLDVQDVGVWAPLHWILRFGKIDMIDAFMVRGAKLDIQSDMVVTSLKRSEWRIGGAMKWTDMFANGAPPESDPSACFEASVVFHHTLSDIEASKGGAVDTAREQLGEAATRPGRENTAEQEEVQVEEIAVKIDVWLRNPNF